MSERVTDVGTGIIRIAVPTPLAVGRVNCYLVDDDPLTLIDTGPNSGTSLTELEAGLRAAGRRVEDLERIVLTHQHMDHIGLARILAERSGAEVVALQALSPWLADYGRSMELDDRFSEAVMVRNGMPQELMLAMGVVASSFRAWGGRVSVTRTVEDGDELEFAARTWRVHHRPGHSPSDTIFHDEKSGLLIGGDHLLSTISSNPLIARPLGSPELPASERPPSLLTYIASLELTAELDVSVVHGGHGEPIDDHRALIAKRIAGHERRAEKILSLIGKAPADAFQIAHQMWGDAAIAQAYLTISEVLGHLDLLERAGRVVRVTGDVDRYELA